MTAANKYNLISVAEYLRGETESPVKHEYRDGFVYAMAGGSNVHNTIAGNIFASWHLQLKGNSCRPFNSDTKIRIRSDPHERYFYPDASVSCRPNPANDNFQDHPSVIAEVLSRRTRRIDEGEKLQSYLTIPSLAAYLLIEQDTPTVIAYRRTNNGFEREVYEGMDAVVPLPEIATKLVLRDIYEDVSFAAETEQES